MIEKFTVSRDDTWYHAWPDLALTPSGKLVCVFSECTHHFDRTHTRIVVCSSDDRGRTWSGKRQVTEPLRKSPSVNSYWNCPRVTCLRDGRMVVVIDRIAGRKEEVAGPYGELTYWLYFSSAEGETWEGAVATPIQGIVPDQLLELRQGPHTGRWLITAHSAGTSTVQDGVWRQNLWFSDDQGSSWSGPHLIAGVPELKLCEANILPLTTGELVCFLRENSWRGLDVFRAISRDGGTTWGELTTLPIPGCHRPVAGLLHSGNILLTYRFLQGGTTRQPSAQNFLAALLSPEDALAPARDEASTRILPVDYDRHPKPDLGYSGWVQFPDGEIYIVNYIKDDAPNGQIRGYSLREDEFVLGSP